MPGHEEFEELCALSALGQVAAEELTQLNEHLTECESCRVATAEFSRLVHAELPLAARQSKPWLAAAVEFFKSSQRRERFLDSARLRGFRFSEEIVRSRPPRPFRFEQALIGVLLGVAVTAMVVAIRPKPPQEKVLVAAKTELQPTAPEPPDARIDKQTQQGQGKTIAKIQGELELTKARLEEALAHASMAEQTRDSNSSEAQRLKAALDAESARSADLTASLEAERRRMASLYDEVQRSNGARAADQALIASQQKRLDDLSQQLRAQTETLNTERQLLAAGKDIRDLMGARSLHIVDVFDADLKGKNRSAFGRVFYTEGKSLIFYAFDLRGEKLTEAKYSFQAWGARDGAPAAAKSLGIFFADDKAQRRWVLKIEDPEALSRIDSVFVTIEPFGGAKQPTGQKLLYAYLKNQANHP